MPPTAVSSSTSRIGPSVTESRTAPVTVPGIGAGAGRERGADAALARRAVLGQQPDDGHDEDDVQRRGAEVREGERDGAGAAEHRGEEAADDRAEGEASAVGGRVLRETRRDVGRGVDAVDGVDVPGLDRAGVQRAADAQHQDRGQEAGEAGRGREDHAGDQVQQRTGDHHRAAAETSASPPVGSSSTVTTTPWTVNSRPISARESPRAWARSTVIGVVRPTGSHRRAVSPTSRRVAERTVCGALMTATPSGARRR